MKAFKKGQRVTVLGDWDRKGTVYIRHATVHSCGSKVLRLTCDRTGDEFGREFPPQIAGPGEVGVRPFLSGEALQAEAAAVAEKVLADQRKSITACIEMNPGEARYIAAMKQDLAELHAPRVAMYSELLEESARAMKQRIADDFYPHLRGRVPQYL